MKKLLICVSTLLLLTSAAHAQEVAPDALIKATATDVLNIIKQDKSLQNNRQKLIELVEARVLPHFDFTRMTRIAVGRFWREASAEQRERLTHEFRTLLVNTYSTSLGSYKDQTIEYLPLRMNPGDTDIVVKTRVLQTGREPIPIDYFMIKNASGWKVYDIAVDGVSLLVNYRSSFAQEIQRGGIDGLIQSLAQKNAQLGVGSKRG